MPDASQGAPAHALPPRPLLARLPLRVQASAPHPPVLPRPVPLAIPLAVPTLSVDTAPADEEAAVAALALAVGEARAAVCRAHAAAADEGDELDGEARGMAEEALIAAVTALDKALLARFQAACAADKIARALDIASQLRLPPCLEASLKLASHYRQPQLAERITCLLQLGRGAGDDERDDDDGLGGAHRLHSESIDQLVTLVL